MPNLSTVFKNEISRVARKEVRTETRTLKKIVNLYRGEIAALKRRAHALELEVRRLSKKNAKAAPAAEAAPGNPGRYSAKSLASQRHRLGLSVSDCGLLVGASPQSIYNWEQGGVRPIAKHLLAIAGLKTMGRRQAAERLQALKDKAA